MADSLGAQRETFFPSSGGPKLVPSEMEMQRIMIEMIRRMQGTGHPKEHGEMLKRYKEFPKFTGVEVDSSHTKA